MKHSLWHRHSIRPASVLLVRPLLTVLLLTSLALRTASFGAETLTVSIPLPEITVTKGAENNATFAGCSLRGDVGHPALPAIVFKVLLPPDTDPKSVRATLINPKCVDLPGKWLVDPMPPPVTSAGRVLWPEKATILDGKDVSAYGADSPQPATMLTACSVAWLREWCLAEILVTPFRYNPSTQTLTQLQSGNVQVEFGRSKPRLVSRSRAESIRARISSLVKNSVVNFTDMKGEYDVIKK